MTTSTTRSSTRNRTAALAAGAFAAGVLALVPASPASANMGGSVDPMGVTVDSPMGGTSWSPTPKECGANINCTGLVPSSGPGSLAVDFP